MFRLSQSYPKRLRHLAVTVLIFAVVTLAPGPSPGSAESTPSYLGPSTNASLPEGLLEAVREALGPQAAAVLANPALTTIQQAKLNAADAEAFDQFGWSVAISSDTAVVGSRLEDHDLGGGPLTDAGSTYVFVSPTDLLYLSLILKN